MRRSTNIGLATAALGLFILVAGLRSAVAAAGGVCAAYSMPGLPAPYLRCGGSCPWGGECGDVVTKAVDSAECIWQCGCLTSDGDWYVSIDAPKCVLGARGDERYVYFVCIRNGCPNPCAEPTYEPGLEGGWSCSCAK